MNALITVLLVASVTGCVAPASSDCGGGVCPPNLKCAFDGDQPRCVLPSRGNGTLDPGEDCDDGNNLSHDMCPPGCTSDLMCGGGVVDPGEGCDDGNVRDHDGCSS